MMMKDRKQELMTYIKMLEGLNHSGINCMLEINQALAELNDLMMRKNKSKKFILVLESGSDGFINSKEMFKDILGECILSDVGIHALYSCELESDEVYVKIVNIVKGVVKNSEDTLIRHLVTGLEPDYLINNTEIKDVDKELSIKVKNNT